MLDPAEPDAYLQSCDARGTRTYWHSRKEVRQDYSEVRQSYSEVKLDYQRSDGRVTEGVMSHWETGHKKLITLQSEILRSRKQARGKKLSRYRVRKPETGHKKVSRYSSVGMPGGAAAAGMVSVMAAACAAGACRSLCRKAFRALRLPCLPAHDAPSSSSAMPLTHFGMSIVAMYTAFNGAIETAISNKTVVKVLFRAC